MSDNVVPIKANDDWGTESSSYDRTDFYTSSRSSDGQSITMSFPVPVHVASQINALIQSGKLPYRSREDFWRDAGHHRLHDLDEMGALDPEASRRISLWRRLEELDRHEAEIESTEQLIAHTKEMVARARGIPDMVLLEKVCREGRAAAAELHNPYQARLLDVVGGPEGEGEQG